MPPTQAAGGGDSCPLPLPAQWLRDGNDNVPCLELERDREKMFECTSADFDGCAVAARRLLLPSHRRGSPTHARRQDGCDDEALGELGRSMASYRCASRARPKHCCWRAANALLAAQETLYLAATLSV